MNGPQTAPEPPAPEDLPGTGRLIVAFSGGPDSTCLLHLLRTPSPARPLVAVHVDHKLDPESPERARRAREWAESRGVEFRLLAVPVEDAAGSGPEAAARSARYRALAGIMRTGDCLLTAHHADDQVETVLLRLLRGAGAAGLAGIQAVRRFGPGWLARPLLGWRRCEIERYLRSHDLGSLADPLNQDLELDRNYLRQVVLPAIERRWPGYRSAILRSAGLCAEAGTAVERQAGADFQACRGTFELTGEIVVKCAGWLKLGRFRANEVLRHWCAQKGLPVPSAKSLESFFRQCQTAAPEQAPKLDWPAACLHRFGARLWLDLKPLPADDWHLDWRPPQAIQLPHGFGCLRVGGTQDSWPRGRWRVGSGRPGEAIRLPGRDHHSPVKELLRVAGVPPWRRRGWPRIYFDGRLLALAPKWLDAEFAGLLECLAAELRWDIRPDP